MEENKELINDSVKISDDIYHISSFLLQIPEAKRDNLLRIILENKYNLINQNETAEDAILEMYFHINKLIVNTKSWKDSISCFNEAVELYKITIGESHLINKLFNDINSIKPLKVKRNKNKKHKVC